MKSTTEFLAHINQWIGRSVAYLALIMAVLTFVIVVLRYGFSIGSIALQESILYMHVTFFMLGLGYTMQEDGHVRVDIFYSKASPATRHCINLIGHTVFLFPLTLVFLMYSWDYVIASWRIQEASPEVGGIPGIFLLKSLIPLSAVLLILQIFVESSESIKELKFQRD